VRIQLLLAAALVVVAAIGYLSWRADQRRRTALQQFARNRGWTYAATDVRLVDRWLDTPFGQGFDRRVRNVVGGTHPAGALGPLPVVAFDYSYRTRSNDSQGRSSTTTHRFAVVAMCLPGYLPRLEVTPENLLTRLGNALGLPDVELESEDFNRRFRVSARDRKFAYDALPAKTMEALLSRRSLNWRIDGTDMLCWDTGRIDPVRILEALATLGDVAAGIPSYVWTDAGVPAPRSTPDPTPRSTPDRYPGESAP
jgi:hypothetical protein